MFYKRLDGVLNKTFVAKLTLNVENKSSLQLNKGKFSFDTKSVYIHRNESYTKKKQ